MYRRILFAFAFALPLSIAAQDFLMQGWYWEFPKSPTTATNWAVRLNNNMEQLADAGFTNIWLPPLSRGTGGGYSNGYDIKDLYDLGEFGQGATGFGTRAEVDALIANMLSLGVQPVADMVYNHRDGGAWEVNPAVEDWIENFSWTQAASGDGPYPTDRWRCYLPVGGSTGNVAGDYYFKVSSASQNSRFHGFGYKVYMSTNRKGFSGLADQSESEPNGGGDCAQGFDDITLGRSMTATIDGTGCTVDEFHLDLAATDFYAAGDTIWIELSNTGDYSDHRIYGLWSGNLAMDIQSQIKYQTRTDYSQIPSGRGQMDWRFFRPNGITPTSLSGFEEWLWFFYDYESSYGPTFDTLSVYTRWLWEEVGLRGFRLDAVKHFPAWFMGGILTDLHNAGHDPGMVVGEYFDYNTSSLNGWVNAVESSMSPSASAAIEVRAFDFALRGALKQACDGFGYDVRNVYNSGMVDGGSGSGFNAVTFVNNHDFRSAGDPPVQNDPMLAYAYILTNNKIGVPAVYYADYYGISRPNAPTINMRTDIDQLMRVHKDFIAGSNTVDYLSRFGTPYASSYTSGGANTTLLYQLGNNPAGKGIVVAINFAGSSLQVSHAVNTGGMGVSVGDTLRAVAGSSNAAFAVVNGSNRINIDLPPRSFAVFVNCQSPTVPANPQNGLYCPTDPIPDISVQDDGLRYDWYDASIGGTLLQQDNAVFSPSGSGSYWVEAVSSCGSSDRVELIVTEDLAACDCSPPASTSTAVISPTSIAIWWDSTADGMGYQVQGREVGTPLWRRINTTATFLNINILMPATTYEWQVRSWCGGSTLSDWTETTVFTTPSLRVAGQSSWNAYPNPAVNHVVVEGQLPETGETLEASIELVDLLGRVLLHQPLVIEKGSFQLNLSTESLESGMYLLVLQRGSLRESRMVEVLR